MKNERKNGDALTEATPTLKKLSLEELGDAAGGVGREYGEFIAWVLVSGRIYDGSCTNCVGQGRVDDYLTG